MSYLEKFKSGMGLEEIPEGERTETVCLAAVKYNGMNLFSVPYELKKNVMCLEAVKSDGMALMTVPIAERTPEVCLAAVKNNGAAYFFVPEDKQTRQLFFEAMKSRVSPTVRSEDSYPLEEERLEQMYAVAAATKDAGKNSMELPTLTRRGGRRKRKTRKMR